MNRFPDAWERLRAAEAAMQALVLVDTAMQHELGAALIAQPGAAVPLLTNTSAKAQAMGAWLMGEEEAKARGIDGTARGVNWMLSSVSLSEALAHLRDWTLQPLPDGTERGYLRIADGRVLRALLRVWSPEQCRTFFAPWRVWMLSDRDGQGRLVDTGSPQAAELERHADVPRTLDLAQYTQLLLESVPDQLMHELKPYVRPHPTLASGEERHRMSVALLAYAAGIGYEEPEDQMTLLAWSLRAGLDDCRYLAHQPAIKQRLRGDALWESLMDGAMVLSK